MCCHDVNQADNSFELVKCDEEIVLLMTDNRHLISNLVWTYRLSLDPAIVDIVITTGGPHLVRS